jgi:hypothetical protein
MQAVAGLPGSLSGTGKELTDVQGDVQIRKCAVRPSDVADMASQMGRPAERVIQGQGADELVPPTR